jgi:hypothetical protein
MFNLQLEPQLIPPRRLSNGQTIFADKNTILDEKIITFDSGFYSVETLEDKKIRWMSNFIELKVHNEKQYEMLLIRSANNFNKKALIVKILNKNTVNPYIYLTREYEIGEKVEIPIPLHNVEKIEIICDHFCPYEEKLSHDQRKLSFLIDNLYFIKNGETFKQSVEYLQETSFYLFKSIIRSEIIESSTNKYFDISEKNVSITKNLKTAIMMYVPFINSGMKKSISNLLSYKISNKNVDLIIVSDDDLNYFDNINCKFIKIPKFPTLKAGGYMTVPHKYATIAFMYLTKIADELGLDKFFFYEWDCKINKDNWYDDLIEEDAVWSENVYMTGTPVLKYPTDNVGNFCQNYMDFVYNYSKECGVSMVIEQSASYNVYSGPFSLYTNGALTFYNTKLTKQMFINEIQSINDKKYDFADKIRAWDYESGIRLFKKYKEESFRRIGWLKSSYSGCGDLYYNEKQRNKMLETKLKNVIHQYKYT